MGIIRDVSQTKEIYTKAGKNGWVIPCFCSENLTTTEAVLSAAEEFRTERGLYNLPVIMAITCLYPHRSQAVNYTRTKRWDTGLKLFTEDIKILCENGGPFENLDVMIHLDHIQHDLDAELLEGDLRDYASVMYDASSLPLEQNIEKTAAFAKERGSRIVVEGACDEIMDACGGNHSDLTTPEQALRYWKETGADLIVCNLGTEHRASGKDLQYHGDVSRQIKQKIGSRIVLHGTSSVSNEQIRNLYDDGICKVNIWTALERDSSPVLFADMARHAGEVADAATLANLTSEGILGEKTNHNAKPQMNLNRFTALYRQNIIFDKMKSIAKEYFQMWYI
ncbi:MAG: class II fructose-bisphosphate aldolase [Oscillospiraceae bacterium]|nr:class II fructose-bisphosphate aldolase [Oscillospiraceae bacterium]